GIGDRETDVQAVYLAPALEQQPHQDQVFVGAIDQDGLALHALDLEADLLVERNRVDVVFADRQFHPLQAKGLFGIQRLCDQALAYTAAAILRQKAHAEHAVMGINRPRLRGYVAPADHFPARQRDELRITLLDNVENERPRRFQRR